MCDEEMCVAEMCDEEICDEEVILDLVSDGRWCMVDDSTGVGMALGVGVALGGAQMVGVSPAGKGAKRSDVNILVKCFDR